MLGLRAGTKRSRRMMTLCRCFARRVNRIRKRRNTLFPLAPATVHGVVFDIFDGRVTNAAAHQGIVEEEL
jgi:hypothetical protein